MNSTDLKPRILDVVRASGLGPDEVLVRLRSGGVLTHAREHYIAFALAWQQLVEEGAVQRVRHPRWRRFTWVVVEGSGA